METDHPQHDSSVDHEVTYRNTVKHWLLYSLDGLEASREPPADDDRDKPNPARDKGSYPSDIYEFAGGDDSIVFSSEREVSGTLSELARDGNPFDNSTRTVARRTEATEWEGTDVKYRYRLTEYGRNVLLDLGIPDKLPNRRDFDEEDRSLGVKPAHEPGWWQPDYELYSSEWDIRDNDWHATSHSRVFYKDPGSEGLGTDRGYQAIGEKLADYFPDVTFVLTVGPHRPHDIMYAIRDPWRKVVQIDVYSPMVLHRSNKEITENVEALIHDLVKGLDIAGRTDD